jgi:hypothetical protein
MICLRNCIKLDIKRWYCMEDRIRLIGSLQYRILRMELEI